MPENTIIYDAEYLTEQSRILNEATELVSEAVKDFQKASLHEGWTCQECNKINESLNDVMLRLNRLNQGMIDTSAALSGELENFDELEIEAENQANNLSENLRENYGFEASVVNGNTGSAETVKAPVTQVPASEGVSANFIEPLSSGTEQDSLNDNSAAASSSSTQGNRIQVKDILKSLGSNSSDSDSASALSSLASTSSTNSTNSSSSSSDSNGTNWLQIILSLIFNKKMEDMNVDKA